MRFASTGRQMLTQQDSIGWNWCRCPVENMTIDLEGLRQKMANAWEKKKQAIVFVLI